LNAFVRIPTEILRNFQPESIHVVPAYLDAVPNGAGDPLAALQQTPISEKTLPAIKIVRIFTDEEVRIKQRLPANIPFYEALVADIPQVSFDGGKWWRDKQLWWVLWDEIAPFNHTTELHCYLRREAILSEIRIRRHQPQYMNPLLIAPFTATAEEWREFTRRRSFTVTPMGITIALNSRAFEVANVVERRVYDGGSKTFEHTAYYLRESGAATNSDDVRRFEHAEDVKFYLNLVGREWEIELRDQI